MTGVPPGRGGLITSGLQGLEKKLQEPKQKTKLGRYYTTSPNWAAPTLQAYDNCCTSILIVFESTTGCIAFLSNTTPLLPKVPDRIHKFLHSVLEFLITMRTCNCHHAPPALKSGVVSSGWWLQVRPKPREQCCPDQSRVRTFSQHVDH
jgi:hypothetical protein